MTEWIQPGSQHPGQEIEASPIVAPSYLPLLSPKVFSGWLLIPEIGFVCWALTQMKSCIMNVMFVWLICVLPVQWLIHFHWYLVFRYVNLLLESILGLMSFSNHPASILLSFQPFYLLARPTLHYCSPVDGTKKLKSEGRVQELLTSKNTILFFFFP